MGPGGQVTITPDQAPAAAPGAPVTITPDSPGMSDQEVAQRNSNPLAFHDTPPVSEMMKHPSLVPNARVRNMPDPSDPNAGMWNLYEGAKTGATLAAIPATIGQPVGPVTRGLIASTIGGLGAKKVAEVAGAGPRGQEVAGDVGGLAAGAMGVKAPELAATRPGQTAGILAKSVGKLPVIDKFVDAGKTLGEIADVWKPKPVTPDAVDPALAQARALFEGSSSPPDPAAGLGTIKQPGQAGSIAASMQKPAPSAEVAPGFQRGSLQTLLDRSLGAKELDPKVPLKNQLNRVTPTSSSSAAPAVTASTSIPEGHTPVQSTALKSYKYDPDANEFHAKYGSADNTVHVFGDVSPDEAKAFEDAPSKGKAMQQIKSSHPLVAKIIDGKRQAMKAAVPTQ